MTTTPKQPKRFGWVLLLLICIFWVGLAVGTAIGAQFVPAGSGLAGPTIALAYGVLGAMLSLIVGGVIGWTTSVQTVRASALIAALLLALVVGYAFWRGSAQRAEYRAASGLDQPLPPPGNFQVDASLTEQDTTRAYREIHIDATDWSFNYIAVGPNADACSGTLKAKEVTAVTETLAAVAMRLVETPPMCDGLSEPGVFAFSQSNTLSVSGGLACLQQEPELMALYTALRLIPLTAPTEARVSCE